MNCHDTTQADSAPADSAPADSAPADATAARPAPRMPQTPARPPGAIRELGACVARGQLYQFLAAAYLWPPTTETITAALDPDFGMLVTEYFGAAVGGQLTALSSETPDTQAIEMAYEELFRVPTGNYTKPFESVYREPYIDGRGRQRQRLMGATAAHVTHFYNAAGCHFDHAATASRMPDFMGAELEFMRYLCERECIAQEAGDTGQLTELRTLQRRFLDEHLATWVEPFCEEVTAKDDTGYHAALAAVLRGHVLADQAHMRRTHPASEDANKVEADVASADLS